MKYWVQIIILVLVLGLIGWAFLDSALGEKETTQTFMTVVDTQTETVRAGKATIRKHYVVVNTVDGEKTLPISAELSKSVEKGDEIEVTKTTTKTKWSNKIEIRYSIEE